MELVDDCNELAGAAKFSHDFPESLTTDCVEVRGQINKGCVEVMVLFHAFLLELAKIMSVVPPPAQKLH